MVNFLAVISPSVLYIVVLIVLFRERRKGGGSYKIMFNLGVADIIQMLCFTPCWLTYFIGATSINPLLNKINGSMLNAAWMTSINLMTVLAINRFAVIVIGRKAELFFEGMGLNIIFIVLWLITIVYFIIYMTPILTVVYVPKRFGWLYTGNEPYLTFARCKQQEWKVIAGRSEAKQLPSSDAYFEVVIQSQQQLYKQTHLVSEFA
ncbi:unnamed protein product [Anisakis simplex]|uniref:G_PROTEIN_RECEP_F1_2 domain-containing protein n=1 Tax=Anisakis simplex TaxID=6269 RepID=A0A0M3KAW1_ANISI|nr:unnamed protein product [Anisakis simplex]